MSTEPAGSPLWHSPRPVLDLAELVVTGALAHLPDLDGVPGVAVPPEVAQALAGPQGVLLEDVEGTPVARVIRGGAVEPLRPFVHGPLRSRRRLPEESRRELAALEARAPALGVLLDGPVPATAIRRVVDRAASTGAPLVWFVRLPVGRAVLGPEALYRAAAALVRDAAAAGVPGFAVPLALPAAGGGDGDLGLAGEVARAHGAAELAVLAEPGAGPGDASGPGPDGSGDPHPAFLPELARSARPPHARGLVVLLTGLSGSGKSTIARGLAERLLDDGTRTVTLLDGDSVRRLLSHGLGFSRADRDLNVRRIGFVAAEVARHGGLALAAPIAPFADVRREVRELAEEVGEFVLVHVATPLEECERRDRKGLYARARRGEIPDFTGISSFYEPPTEADLTIDTTGRPVQECVEAVWRLLRERGYLPRPAEPAGPGPA